MEIMGTMWILLASIMFVYAMFQLFFSHIFGAELRTYSKKLTSLLSPYDHISFHKFGGEHLKQNETLTTIQTYLSANSSQLATRSMDDNEEITDEFRGVKLWWVFNKTIPPSDEKRFLTLTFHKRHRDLITGHYLKHVLDEGKVIASKNRQLKLYTNVPIDDWEDYKNIRWSHKVFEHPATFDALALDPNRKEDILKDLINFQNGKNFYKKIGKPWKRGYLIYGPSGTDKSTMIAAMANFLNYDIYDIQLTAVKDDAGLRMVLTEIPSQSIIMIKNVDHYLDLTGQRKRPKDTKAKEEGSKNPVKISQEEENKSCKVTRSGLANFVDGIWSGCREERIFVFTTDHVNKLDPGLIRRGRMDMHIELSYCCYEAFKVLAKNCLAIDSHHLYGRIGELLEETNMTPGDVAQNLMPKSRDEKVETCLERLVEALETTKLEARKSAEIEKEERREVEKEVNPPQPARGEK